MKSIMSSTLTFLLGNTQRGMRLVGKLSGVWHMPAS